MSVRRFDFKSGNQLSARSVLTWRLAQGAVWLAGMVILFCLFFFPALGIKLFWNILIPVAPALFVLATGVWRNLCPLGTTILLPRHLGWGKPRKLTVNQLGFLNLIAVLAFYIIVPLRHAIFNNSGRATGSMIVIMASIGVTMGFFYEWKSAWCSSLCPIHPVEKLYGENVLLPVPNAHCLECVKCVIPCPDSTPNINPTLGNRTIYQHLSGILIIGGLPGFIWGWFQVPDETVIPGFAGFISMYAFPLAGMTCSLLIYTLLSKIIQPRYERKLTGFFAASGVSCYYWYRIPSLLGFGKFAGDGQLLDLRRSIPVWVVYAITTLTVVFFFYWLVVRKSGKQRWVVRPEYARQLKRANTRISPKPR